MTATAAPTFKPLSMADSCLLSLPSVLTSKPPYLSLSIPSRPPIKLHLTHSHSFSLSLKPKTHFSSLIPLVAQTFDWAQQEEENDVTVVVVESEQEQDWDGQENETEARVSDWDPEGEDAVAGQKEGGGEEEEEKKKKSSPRI